MSAVFCVDTAMLAIPNYAEDELEAEEIILRLKAWADAALAIGNERILRTSTAEQDLGALGFFPGLKNVEDLIEFSGLKGVYDAQTVWSTYNTILNRAGLIEEAIGFEVTEVEDVELDPGILNDVSPAGLRSVSERLFGTISVANDVHGAGRVVLASAASQAVDSVNVSLLVKAARGTNLAALGALPIATKSSVLTARRFEGALRLVSALTLWRAAQTESDFHFAIMLRALEIIAESGNPPLLGDVPKFAIGSSFIGSLKANGSAACGPFSETVLECCSRVILGCPKEPLKPFGRPEQEQRKYDGAKALRSHVTSKGVALRLMVWEKRCGTIELANVGPKGELRIESGMAA